MRRRWLIAGAALLAAGGVYAANASWLAPVPEGVPGVLAHRGVHQTFPTEGLTRDTCTASRIHPPTNPYLENTIPSMQASFAAGATAIEVDVHPTTDGEFAVFHDWRLECRTDGRGVTRRQSMAHLRTLDVGFGYTADGGSTFPFRGRGIGLMPTLDEVLTAFPGRPILINVKSRDPSESERLVAYLRARGHPTDERLWVFADGAAHERLRALAPRARIDSKARAKSCVTRYLALGWSGHVPNACRGASMFVPVNLRRLYWGWPNRFLARMRDAGAHVVLVGPYGGDEDGISQVAELDAVPPGFTGEIMTNHVERIGPEVRRRWPAVTEARSCILSSDAGRGRKGERADQPAGGRSAPASDATKEEQVTDTPERRPLGDTEFAIAPLMLGGNVFGWTADEPTSFALLDRFVDAGFNAVDTADVYSRWIPGHVGGESETVIGNWLAQGGGRRERIVLATKVGMDMGDDRNGLSRRWILRAVEDSLRRLRTDHIDLYQSHQPDDATPIEETLRAYEELVASGKVRAIGASNYDAAQLAAALDASEAEGLPRYATLQPGYNLYDRAEFEGELEALCLERGLGVICYFSLASGFLTGKYRSEADLKGSPRAYRAKNYLDARGLGILGALDAVGGELGATPAQVALAWLMARPAVTAPIASATSTAQLDELLGAARLRLSPDQIERLDAASAGGGAAADPDVPSSRD